MITQEEKQRIILELNKRFNSSGIKCPMCGNNHFIIGDGYFNSFMQDDFRSLNLVGPSIPSIPSIPIICDRCGFISSHALGVLGLLPKNDNEGKKGGDNGR